MFHRPQCIVLAKIYGYFSLAVIVHVVLKQEQMYTCYDLIFSSWSALSEKSDQCIYL